MKKQQIEKREVNIMRDVRVGREKLDQSFLKVYTGVAIEKGQNYSQLLGALMYKRNYWEFECKDYLYQLYIANDCFFYITHTDLTECSHLSARQFNPELDRLVEDGIIEMQERRKGKPLYIRFNYPKAKELIRESENLYVSNFRSRDFRETKESIKQATIQKIKDAIINFLKKKDEALVEDILDDVA